MLYLAQLQLCEPAENVLPTDPRTSDFRLISPIRLPSTPQINAFWSCLLTQLTFFFLSASFRCGFSFETQPLGPASGTRLFTVEDDTSILHVLFKEAAANSGPEEHLFFKL